MIVVNNDVRCPWRIKKRDGQKRLSNRQLSNGSNLYSITRAALRTSLGMSGSVYGCMAIFSELTVQMDSINSNEIPSQTFLRF